MPPTCPPSPPPNSPGGDARASDLDPILRNNRPRPETRFLPSGPWPKPPSPESQPPGAEIRASRLPSSAPRSSTGGCSPSGSHKGTYDAYVHIFFADHYAERLVQHLGTPLVHRLHRRQLPAGNPSADRPRLPGARSRTRLRGGAARGGPRARDRRLPLRPPLGRARDAAGWAAIAMALSSSLTEVVHVFGQLPTTLSLALLLNAQPSIRRWTHDGRRSRPRRRGGPPRGHHGLPPRHDALRLGLLHRPGGGPSGPRPVGPAARRRARRPPGRGHRGQPAPARRPPGPAHASRPRAAPRCSAFLTVAALVIVVLPYWLWSSSDPITQVPIPHASRDELPRRTPTPASSSG